MILRTTCLILALFAATAATAQTQSEMNANAQKEFLSTDRVMTKVLDAVRTELTQAQSAALTIAQDKWTAYRDACAESEAGIYSGGSIQPMIYYGAMTSLTQARIDRLRDMLPEPVDVEEIEEEVAEEEMTGEPEESGEPVEPDPQDILSEKLGTEAVQSDIEDTKTALGQSASMRSFVELMVPAEAKLAEVLENQGLKEEYVTWIANNPSVGRDLVLTAVRAEFEKRKQNDRSEYSDTTVIAVSEYLRDQQSDGGFTSRPVGQILGALTIENRAPYRYYRYLYPDRGLAALTQAWIDKAAAVE